MSSTMHKPAVVAVAAVATFVGGVALARGHDEWHAAIATAVLLVLGVRLALRQPRNSSSSPPTSAPGSPRDRCPAPEHPYYGEIDKQTTRFRSESVVNRSESRRRAAYRSHDPRRWRAQLWFREPEEEEEQAPAPLFDWAAAEEALDALESRHGMIIQRPPLGYSEASACRLCKEAGCEWYFSISDFDEAILTGTVAIKNTDGAQRVHIDLRTPEVVQLEQGGGGPRVVIDLTAAEDGSDTPPRKPLLLKKRSPSGIMDFPRITRDTSRDPSPE